MTHNYDSFEQLSTNDAEIWKNSDPKIFDSLKYWIRYPDIAVNDHFGISSGNNGAERHFNKFGRDEGRLWGEPSKSFTSLSSLNKSTDSYRDIKTSIMDFFVYLSPILLSIASIVLFTSLLFLKSIKSGSLYIKLIYIFLFYVSCRVGIMSYVSVYMGYLDVRLFFSSNILLLLFALIILSDCFNRFNWKTNEYKI